MKKHFLIILSFILLLVAPVTSFAKSESDIKVIPADTLVSKDEINSVKGKYDSYDEVIKSFGGSKREVVSELPEGVEEAIEVNSVEELAAILQVNQNQISNQFQLSNVSSDEKVIYDASVYWVKMYVDVHFGSLGKISGVGVSSSLHGFHPGVDYTENTPLSSYTNGTSSSSYTATARGSLTYYVWIMGNLELFSIPVEGSLSGTFYHA